MLLRYLRGSKRPRSLAGNLSESKLSRLIHGADCLTYIFSKAASAGRDRQRPTLPRLNDAHHLGAIALSAVCCKNKQVIDDREGAWRLRPPPPSPFPPFSRSLTARCPSNLDGSRMVREHIAHGKDNVLIGQQQAYHRLTTRTHRQTTTRGVHTTTRGVHV